MNVHIAWILFDRHTMPLLNIRTLLRSVWHSNSYNRASISLLTNVIIFVWFSFPISSVNTTTKLVGPISFVYHFFSFNKYNTIPLRLILSVSLEYYYTHG